MKTATRVATILAVLLAGAPGMKVQACLAADPCGDLAILNAQYAQLSLEVVERQNEIRALGVEMAAEARDYSSEAEYLNAAAKRHALAEEGTAAGVSLAMDAMQEIITKATPAQLESAAKQLRQMPPIGAKLADTLTQIARRAAGDPARLQLWQNAVKTYLGPAFTSFKIATSSTQRGQFLEMIGTLAGMTAQEVVVGSSVVTLGSGAVAAVVAPILLDAGDATGRYYWNNLRRFMAMDRPTLAKLKSATDAFEAAVRQRAATKERLARIRASGVDCDSVHRVKPPSDNSPKPQPKAKDKHVGRSVAIGMIAAGVGGGLAAKSLAQASSTSWGDSFGGSGGTPTIVDTHQPWICSGSLCKGQLTINFPVVMNSGTITVGTDSMFLGQKPVSPTSPAGTVTFDMEKSRNPSTCYGTQTTVGIWNSSVISVNGVPVAATYQLSTSIRIECR